MRAGESFSHHVGQCAITALAMIALLAGGGCSFVASSKSSSDIISSPFKSSSNSVGGEDTAYQEQAEDYSRAYAEVGGGEPEAFQRGLSDLAGKLGISDWEGYPGTWMSVGRGLGQARVSGGEMMTYAANWTGGDAGIMELIFQGYAQTR